MSALHSKFSQSNFGLDVSWRTISEHCNGRASCSSCLTYIAPPFYCGRHQTDICQDLPHLHSCHPQYTINYLNHTHRSDTCQDLPARNGKTCIKISIVTLKEFVVCARRKIMAETYSSGTIDPKRALTDQCRAVILITRFHTPFLCYTHIVLSKHKRGVNTLPKRSAA